MDSMANTNSKFSSRRVKWGLLAGLVVCSGLAYRSYGYRLTVGNLFGMKVQPIFIKDNDTGQVYDANGILIRTDPVKNNLYDHRGREVEYSVSGAKNTRIYLNDRQPFQASTMDGRITQLFPIQDSNKSIAYRIEATADDWQLLDTWDTKSPSNKFSFVPGRMPNLRVTNLPPGDPQKDEFLVKIYRSKGGDPYAAKLNPFESYFYSEYPNSYVSLVGDIEGVYKIELFRRTYKVVSEGFLSFGKKGDAHNLCNTNLPTLVTNLAEVDKSDSFKGTQWSKAGIKQEYKPSFGIQMGFGAIDKGMRLVKCRLLASPTEFGSTLKLSSPQKDIVFEQTMRTGAIFQERTEWEATMFVPRTLRKFDLKVDIAAEPFQEILRTSTLQSIRAGTEAPGTAIFNVESPYGMEYTTYKLKVPEKYRGQDLRLFYFKSDGQEQTPNSNGLLPNGYQCFSFRGSTHPQDDVQGLILKARPFKTTTIKDLPLYPSP